MTAKLSAGTGLLKARRKNALGSTPRADTMTGGRWPELLDPEAFAYLMVFGVPASADGFLDALRPSKRRKG